MARIIPTCQPQSPPLRGMTLVDDESEVGLAEPVDDGGVAEHEAQSSAHEFHRRLAQEQRQDDEGLETPPEEETNPNLDDNGAPEATRKTRWRRLKRWSDLTEAQQLAWMLGRDLCIPRSMQITHPVEAAVARQRAAQAAALVHLRAERVARGLAIQFSEADAPSSGE